MSNGRAEKVHNVIERVRPTWWRLV
jgi:hypothetical protein